MPPTQPPSQCCKDADTIFSSNFDDGSPASALFTSIIAPFAIVGGSGIAGTSALVASSYGEGRKLFPSDRDICNEPRTEFAVGFFFDDAELNDFYIFELRNSIASGGSAIVSVQNSARDLVIYKGTTSDEAFRLINAFDVGVLNYYEVRGSLGTLTTDPGQPGLLLTNADGWVEVRINGFVYNNGEDVSAIDVNDPLRAKCPKPGTKNIRWVEGRLPDSGWDLIVLAPQGALDCLYVKERAAYCINSNTTTSPPGTENPPCPPNGPDDPVVIPPGGFVLGPSDYVEPSGVGIPSTAADPTDAQTLIGIAVPEITFDLTLTDTSVERYSQVDGLPASARAAADGRILRIGPVEYPLSDRFGSVKAQQWQVDLADPDGRVRGLLDSAANYAYRRWQGHLYGESDTARIAGTARRSLARGRVTNVSTNAPQVVSLTLSDEFSNPNSPFSGERKCPHVLVKDIYTSGVTGTGLLYLGNTPPASHAVAMRLIYGEASDQRVLLDGQTPTGIVPLTDVGEFQIAGETWRGFMVSLYACKRIIALFGTNGGSNPDGSCPGSVIIDPTVYDGGSGQGRFLVPGLGDWSTYFSTNYNDLTVNGKTYRTTMVFGQGAIAKAAIDGVVPLSVNVWGKEDVGDSTGNLIWHAAYIAQEFLEHPALSQALIGNEAAPTFADGVPMVKTSTAVTATAIQHTFITGGYRTAWILSDQKSSREHLADLLQSAGLRVLTANHHGQIEIHAFDDKQSVAALPLYSDLVHVRNESFTITQERGAELENGLVATFAPAPSTGRIQGPHRFIDTASAAAWSADGAPFYGEERHYQAIYTLAMLIDVVGRELVKTKDGITRGELAGDFDLLALTPGDCFQLQAIDGLGPTGWTDRVLLAESLIANYHISPKPTPEDWGVTVKWEDVDKILVRRAGGIIVGSRVGFHPLGDDTVSPGTGTLLGDRFAGTSSRLG